MRGLRGEGGYSNYILGTYRKMTEMVRKTPEPMGDYDVKDGQGDVRAGKGRESERVRAHK